MNTSRQRFSTIVGVIAGAWILGQGGTAWSQQPQIRQTETLPPPAQPPPAQVEEMQTEESDDLGPIIVLKRASRPKYFQAYSDTQYLYDSNVFLTPDHADDDWLLYQTFNASFSPQLLDKLGSSVSVRYQMVRYNTFDDANFDAQIAALNLNYRLTDWLTPYVGFAAERLVPDDSNKEFYEEYDTQFGLWCNLPLGKRVWLYYGYQLDWRPATPSSQTRVEYAGYLGLNATLIGNLTGQIFYRVRDTEYLQIDQSDLDQFVQGTLMYTFNEYVNCRVYASYENNE